MDMNCRTFWSACVYIESMDPRKFGGEPGMEDMGAIGDVNGAGVGMVIMGARIEVMGEDKEVFSPEGRAAPSAKALPDQETDIRFFKGLYKHEVSQGIIDDIGTFGFESRQYLERRGLYEILSTWVQDFDPRVFSLPALHDEELVLPFEGI
ncbi:unnamed protein product [Cuscuta campestris]|uniref:Uncharacterized protein n=1 Tax=Cuscuta campestris TaxID=132261 RepID=A0A484LQR3_9ASTE|nr:unnamed protein product [Cuscuta campestris]